MPAFIEQLLRPVPSQPIFQDFQMSWIFPCTSKRHLVRTPITLYSTAVHFLRSGPSFRTAQHNHGPTPPGGSPIGASLPLNTSNFRNALLKSSRHFLVHEFDVVAFHEMRCPPVSLEQLFQFFVRYARKQCRVVDLVSVQIENGQHGPVADRAQKLVGVPRCC